MGFDQRRILWVREYCFFLIYQNDIKECLNTDRNYAKLTSVAWKHATIICSFIIIVRSSRGRWYSVKRNVPFMEKYHNLSQHGICDIQICNTSCILYVLWELKGFVPFVHIIWWNIPFTLVWNARIIGLNNCQYYVKLQNNKYFETCILWFKKKIVRQYILFKRPRILKLVSLFSKNIFLSKFLIFDAYVAPFSQTDIFNDNLRTIFKSIIKSI